MIKAPHSFEISSMLNVAINKILFRFKKSKNTFAVVLWVQEEVLGFSVLVSGQIFSIVSVIWV